MCSVRPMIEVDIPRVVEIAYDNFNTSRYSDLTFDKDGLKSVLEASLDNDSIQVFVAVHDLGQVIGALGAITIKTPWLKHISASEMLFAIDAAYRGFKPAILLLRAYKNWAFMCGAVILNVHADHSVCDARVAKLYEKAGFVPNGYSLQMRSGL